MSSWISPDIAPLKILLGFDVVGFLSFDFLANPDHATEFDPDDTGHELHDYTLNKLTLNVKK